ncbi:unnamed protein product [Didymodactylos carnosus]|uniref:Uncharacterized protein n=1 Tax=Didymodactylos carnosus TaxID=1234261 RepID=A0A814NSP9_9BILA|nr:unnamed protein product [Didymodactylos carnosus]CAF3862122.1 unnamed protein product [Didymodactylos carnosus]
MIKQSLDENKYKCITPIVELILIDNDLLQFFQRQDNLELQKYFYQEIGEQLLQDNYEKYQLNNKYNLKRSQLKLLLKRSLFIYQQKYSSTIIYLEYNQCLLLIEGKFESIVNNYIDYIVKDDLYLNGRSRQRESEQKTTYKGLCLIDSLQQQSIRQFKIVSSSSPSIFFIWNNRDLLLMVTSTSNNNRSNLKRRFSL